MCAEASHRHLVMAAMLLLLLGGARDVVGRLLLVLMLVLHAVAQDRVVVAAREEVWKEMEERDDMWVVPHAWYRVRVHTGGLS